MPMHHTCQVCTSAHLLFDGDIFPSFCQINITFETVLHDTLAISTAFVTEAPAKHAPTITPRSKSQRSHLAAILALNSGLEPQPAYMYIHGERTARKRFAYFTCRSRTVRVVAPYFFVRPMYNIYVVRPVSPGVSIFLSTNCITCRTRTFSNIRTLLHKLQAHD